MMGTENEYGAKKLEELQRFYQFIDLHRDFVLEHFTAYREKIKGMDILRLKLLNNLSTFKHELKLGVLTIDQYQKKIGILGEKISEQELIKDSINDQFILNVFGASRITLPPEIIIVHLQEVFL